MPPIPPPACPPPAGASDFSSRISADCRHETDEQRRNLDALAGGFSGRHQKVSNGHVED
jgi:hypothetical protein